jgi:hypothetical protein
VYTEYQVGKDFSCEVSIDERPGQPFGNKNTGHSKKKVAKAAAAKDAVTWLRENGYMSTDQANRKKRKVSQVKDEEMDESEPVALPKKEVSYAHRLNGKLPPS